MFRISQIIQIQIAMNNNNNNSSNNNKNKKIIQIKKLKIKTIILIKFKVPINQESFSDNFFQPTVAILLFKALNSLIQFKNPNNSSNNKGFLK